VRLWREEFDWGLVRQSFAAVAMPNIAFYTNPQNYLDNTRCPSYITQHIQFHRRSTMTNAKVFFVTCPTCKHRMTLAVVQNFHYYSCSHCGDAIDARLI
jgi:hypothetical protein